MPGQLTELGGEQPQAGEDPFYCLLEDDKSIFEFNVKTDRLLAPPKNGEATRDVVAIISVHVMTDERSELFGLSAGFDFLNERPA
jgi:hypothetical protein